MRRPLAVAGAVLAILVAAPSASAQFGESCSPYSSGELFPGTCAYQDYEITNTSLAEATLTARFNPDAFVVRDDRTQAEVTGAERNAFLSSLTASWERLAFVSVPDPGDASRPNPSTRTGGIDVAVGPTFTQVCGDRQVTAQTTAETACQIGRLHAMGSRAISGQRTDIRIVRLIFRLALTANPNHYLAAYSVVFGGIVPPRNECPTPTVSNVCTTPVYTR